MQLQKQILTIPHNRTDAESFLDHLANVARLLLELAQGAHLGRLARVDQAGGDLDAHFVDGRPELLLQEE